jgi:hypothetical protein
VPSSEVNASRSFGKSAEQKFSTGLRDGSRTELQGYSTQVKRSNSNPVRIKNSVQYGS